MFGKLMSISDTLMWRYFELLSFRSLDDISSLQQQIRDGGNPRDAKIELAREIVARFHSRQAADEALLRFQTRFRDGVIPAEMPEVNIGPASLGIPKILPEAVLAVTGSETQRNARSDAGSVGEWRVRKCSARGST